jgi:hypothetical protein
MVVNKEESMRKLGYAVVGVGIALAAMATAAVAGTTSAAPEINPTSVSAGLALLAGGVLLVRARLRK